MGMAASQARLLSITARIHDVEYQAQSIQNAKVQLSTQQDQVYNEYMEALDAEVLTFKMIDDGYTSTVVANYNNLFSINAADSSDGSKFALRNEQGLLVVDPDVYDAYDQFKNDDPYAFAIYMMSGDSKDPEKTAGSIENGNYTKSVQEMERQAYKNALKSDDKDKKIEKDSELEGLHSQLEKYTGCDDIYDASKVKEEDLDKYNAKLREYRDKLYKKLGEDICTQMPKAGNNAPADKLMENFDLVKFQKYVDKFNQIKLCGGCVKIDDYNGMFGDASNNSDWLTSMVKCGKFTIDTFNKDKNGKYYMNGTAPSSDSSLSYTNVSSVDNTAVKKAEAKYEHDLKEIDQKDKKFDLSLSKLETERQALTTEYDSVKKVIQDNIDRTFGIFS